MLSASSYSHSKGGPTWSGKRTYLNFIAYDFNDEAGVLLQVFYSYLIRSVHIQIQLCLLEWLWIALFSKYLETLLIYWIPCQINTPWMIPWCKFIKENSVTLMGFIRCNKGKQIYTIKFIRENSHGSSSMQ